MGEEFFEHLFGYKSGMGEWARVRERERESGNCNKTGDDKLV